MEIPSGPKGTRDFYPDAMIFQEYLFSSWRKTCIRYGFEAYDAPMFEHLALYTQKSGAEIEKQLYVFEDKGQRVMALRPEMTPSLARMIAAKGPALKRPVRWYSIARLFRYEKMQKGRLREFYQLNMDILGSAEPHADAELIAAVIDMMRDLKLTKNDFQVRVSSRTLLEECFSAIGLVKEQTVQLYALLDRKNKIPGDDYQAELTNIIPDDSARNRVTALFETTSLEEIALITGATPGHASLTQLFLLLDKYDMSEYICFDIGIVRGLAYYTGTVFEVFALGKEMRAIAGGGRYDKLVELYGGIPTPAVGFAAGDVVLGNLLREKGLFPDTTPHCDVYIVSLDDTGFDDVIPVAGNLRDAGISCKFSFRMANVGKQLKQADSAGARCVLFTGGTEAADGTMRIRHLGNGSEQVIRRDDMQKAILSILASEK